MMNENKKELVELAKKELKKLQREEEWLITHAPHAQKRKEIEFKIEKLKAFLKDAE